MKKTNSMIEEAATFASHILVVIFVAAQLISNTE